MDRKSASELDHLLADGELSGSERDAIFERVMADVSRAEPSRVRSRIAWGIGGGLAIAAAALLAVGSHLGRQSELTARGTAGPAETVQVRCAEGRLTACPLSSKLVFVVAGGTRQGFLSAYAEPVDGHAERVWYFSSEGESPSVAAQPANTQVLERAVRLAGAHQPGRYRVHVFLADRALRRDEMLADTSAPGVRAQLQTDLTVLEH